MSDDIKLDHKIICNIVEEQTKILYLGCGEGQLLFLLKTRKNAHVQGIELDEKAIYKCVEKGLSVFHGDMESGIKGYPDNSFDYVILNQSMQEVKDVNHIISEALRIGEKVIVGIPNFAFFQARCRLFFKGKVPITKSLPYRWFDTPNLHFLSLTDFIDFCREKSIAIKGSYYLKENKRVYFLPNLFALNGIFVITKT